MSAKIEIIRGGGVTSPAGFLAGATYAGLKKNTPGVLDLAILYSEESSNTAAVFTTNKVKAAPVIWDQKIIQNKPNVRALIVNSGCANACTGDQGLKDAESTAIMIGHNMGISYKEVMVASTGVIGIQLPMDKINRGINSLILSRDGGEEFARAIMTTDTRLKQIALNVKSDAQEFTIGGAAKGAGMIHPNMATMLAFLTTDAAAPIDFLQKALKKAVDLSFNLVSVDGDTSTNDTVILMANGLAGGSDIKPHSSLAVDFEEALQQVCLHLAKSIASDGEGATRLIEVKVNGAKSVSDARLAARTIASSSLVKAAVHGCDPNWGRIGAAAGRSGAEMLEEKTDIYIGDLCLLKSGSPLPFDKKAASKMMDQAEVLLRIDFNLGRYSATAWGCDLSEEYVAINAEYTT